MAKSDPRTEQSSKKSKRQSFFSIRNGVVLLLVIGVLAVGGKTLGWFDKPGRTEKAAGIQTPGEQTPRPQAVQEKPAGTHAASAKTAVDLMDKKFVAFEETLTAGQAVERLKEKEISFEHPQPVYVLDSLGRLVGETTPGKLLIASENAPLKEIMARHVETVEINTDAAAAAEKIRQSEGAVLPVVDMAGRLVGLISEESLKARAESETSVATHENRAEKQSRESESEVHSVRAQSPTEAPTRKESAQGAEKTETGAAAAAQQGVKEGKAVAVAQEQTHTAKAAESEAGSRARETAAEPARAKGVAFVEAMIKPLKYEIKGRFWGWRPNDILDFTDNVNEFQLGVLEVTRRTAVALAERISRTGSIEAFDKNVQNAMNWLMVKSDRYWLPSPEYKYNAAMEELEKYNERLKRGEAAFYTRQDNLIPLLAAFKDLLGSCEENLVKAKEEDGQPVSFFKADNYFYYAQGVASAMHTILEAVAEDFQVTVKSRRGMQELEHAIHWCHAATEIHPWLILDSSPGSIFANHRANLAAPISHARFHLGVLIRTLST